MLRFISKRLLWSIPTLLIVTFLVFVAIRIGTDPVAAYKRSNSYVTPEQIARFKEKNGLTGTVFQQYFVWLKNFVTGNWGVSIVGSRPVWPSLQHAIANTIVLGLFASAIGISIGLGIGILSALKQHSVFDTGASAGAFVGLSIPPYVSAILLQMLFAIYLTDWLDLDAPLLPTSGIYPPGHEGFDPVLRVKYMILPATVIAIQTIAIYSRYMRASLLEVKNSEYMRTARAKGISERRVIVKHALRNAMIPIVTFAALDLGAIIGGLIITERIFQYRGMGDYFLTAFENGDFKQLMPWMVIVVISLIVFNLMADVTYAWLDPRIRLS
jgi:peptide/nickel transport system permease protein